MVPSEECPGLDNDQRITPVEQPGKQHERNSDRRVRPARSGFALLEHGQLFAQEEILGSECALRVQGKPVDTDRSPSSVTIVLTPPMTDSILPYHGGLRGSEVTASLRINKIQLLRTTGVL